MFKNLLGPTKIIERPMQSNPIFMTYSRFMNEHSFPATNAPIPKAPPITAKTYPTFYSAIPKLTS